MPIGSPGEKGQLYEISDSAEKINWEALQDRAAKKFTKDQKRTAQATKTKGGVSSHDIGSGVSSHDTGGVSSHDTNQTQSIKPKTHTNVQPAAEIPEEARKNKRPDPRLHHPSLIVYRSHAHLHVPIDWREEVVVQVGSEVEAVDLWEKIIHDWIGHGWNKQNIKGMLEAHAAGGLRTINKNGARGSCSAHKDADEMSAFRENNPGVDLGKILSGSGSGSET